MRDPGLRLGILRLSDGEPSGADLGELVVGRLVIGESAVLQMEDRTYGPVQETPVVAYDQNRMRVAGEVAFEPERPLKIEIVCRLVEEQQVGRGKEHGSQSHPHPPATGEGGAGHPLLRIAETQPFQDRTGAGLRRPGVDIREPGLDFRYAGRVRRFFGQKLGTLGVGGQHRVEQRDLAARNLLADAADSCASGDLDPARFRCQFAPDQAKERGLTGAVAPDEADLVAARDQGSGALDQWTALDRIGDVLNPQHEADLRGPRGRVNRW